MMGEKIGDLTVILCATALVYLIFILPLYKIVDALEKIAKRCDETRRKK